MSPDQEAFEQAAYVHYLERHAAGKTSDKDQSVGSRDDMFWKQEDGTYGVLMFNAAWWGWQAALRNV